MNRDEYDGVYFRPTEDQQNLEMAFFKAERELGTPIEGNETGDKFHFAFFKFDENDVPMLDDVFEAILGDPLKYLTGLVGSGLFGCILRKCENSAEWFQEYVDSCQQQIDRYVNE